MPECERVWWREGAKVVKGYAQSLGSPTFKHTVFKELEEV